MKFIEIAKALPNSSIPPQLSAVEPIGYSIDSRTMRAGDLFVAIRGENNDGHEFVCQALESGALAAVIEQSFDFSNQKNCTKTGEPSPSNSLADLQAKLIRVPDTLAALQALSAQVIDEWRGTVIGITGSAGKTTTKDATATILGVRRRTHKSIGNLNNAYGLPLSILKMESDGKRASDYDVAVLEMGMNHKGEIAQLTALAPPHIGVVTNVNAVHLEFFASVDEIAEAKAEVVDGVRSGGWAVLNADDLRVARMSERRSDIKCRTFGIKQPADVRASEIATAGMSSTRFLLRTPEGEADVTLPMIGLHNVYNVLAAAAVGGICGLNIEEIAEGIARCSPSYMRGQLIEFEQGFTVIDDSYNSNPAALSALVESITRDASPGLRRIVVAGEMLELGTEGPRLHRESGRVIAEAGVDLLVGVRGLAREIVEGAREAGLPASQAIFAEDAESAADVLVSAVRPGDLVLVKGSRGVKMEAVVKRMLERFPRKPVNNGKAAGI